MRHARERNVRWWFALACVCAWPAHAQVSGSVGVVSEYRYRGVSLSDDKPALQGSIAYDATKGAYFGLFASTIEYEGVGGFQLIPYAGYARRDKHGNSWDVGLRAVHFTQGSEGDYLEAHVGVALRHVALRLHFAPEYFGDGPNWYAQADGSVPIRERFRWLWHVGVTRGSGDRFEVPDYDYHGYYTPYYVREERTHVDLRTGFSLTTRACDVSLTWHHLDGDDTIAYPAPFRARDRSGWVLGCVHRW